MADKSRSPPEQQTEFEYRNLIAIFGELSKENSQLGSATLFWIAQSLSHQQRNGIHRLDTILKQRLLAVPEDELALYNAVNATFKGGTKPMLEDIELGSDMTQGTLYWRSPKMSATGHLAQRMEIVDRDTQRRSFTWVAPLSLTWPPPLTLSTEVADDDLRGAVKGEQYTGLGHIISDCSVAVPPTAERDPPTGSGARAKVAGRARG